ncbi:thiamine pyrophosphate-dependent enzyme [Candidatus Omnitrophota bacterium]
MANIKELSKLPEHLGPGHRLCSGCGASIAVRQILMGAGTSPIVVGSATGCLEVATTIYPYTAWNTPFIHNAFENSAATMSGVETAYRALKKKGKIKKDIKFIAFGGDGGTYDIGLQSLSGALERGHNFVYVCYDNGAYMNCLSRSSIIMTKEGAKNITDIKVGDEVYAFNQTTHELVLKQCSGVFDNGVKDVFELKTLHHTIRATGNHPFLVLKRNGRGRTNTFEWKMLEDVKLGDEIVALKQLNTTEPQKFDFTKVQKGDYKVNKINDINIPEKSSPGLMKYLGLYVGDGWIRPQKGETGFAIPEETLARKELLNLHASYFGNSLKSDSMYVYINSVNLSRFIDSLGFNKGAKNKTIPGWVFTLPKEEKEAFIEGLMLSDGYKLGKSYRYVSASTDLLKTLRLLLQTMDYRVGGIHRQTKEKGTICVKRPLLKTSEYGYVCFSKPKGCDTEKYLPQSKYRNFLVDNEYFSTEKVQSVICVGPEPTLDLRVEDEHNFIADGIVVHNTGIQRSGATPTGASTTTAPAGKESYGKPQNRKDLTAIVAAHNIPYAAQGSISHWNDLITKSQKAFEVEGPAFINVLALCHRGWRYAQENGVALAKTGVDTCFWPLYEVTNGKEYKLNYKPKEKKPITEWLKPQGRFKHLFKPGNEAILQQIQDNVDLEWVHVLKKCGVE